MLTSEDIKLLSQLMDEKLKPIDERLDTIDETQRSPELLQMK